jgi:predicted acetyltransferase
MSLEIRRLRADDMEQAWKLDRQAFHTRERNRRAWLTRSDPVRIHGAFDQARLVAMVQVLPLGQFFGGRRVAMGGISSVAVSPEHRGQGLASRLLRDCVADMHARGEVVSALYPATTQLYRRAGWELAGAHVMRRIRARDLVRGAQRPRAGRVRRATRDDLPAIRALYARVARESNGFLRLYELLGVDREALSGLWWLVGSSSSQAPLVLYPGGPEDSLPLLLPDQDERVVGDIRWMLRVVDAPGAVAQRGFPPGLEVEIALSLVDALVAENAGAFVLRVSKGEGRLETGGSGGLRLGVGAFSALYTGWATPAVLARTGLLAGGSAEERARLDAAFAGPTPTMLDEF